VEWALGRVCLEIPKVKETFERPVRTKASLKIFRVGAPLCRL